MACLTLLLHLCGTPKCFTMAHIHPLKHTFTHQWVAAAMQGAAELCGSNLGKSIDKRGCQL